MKIVTVEHGLDDWRTACRQLLAEGRRPDTVVFRAADDAQTSLFGALSEVETPGDARLAVSRPHVGRPFIELAGQVAHHRDTARWDVLYRLLWRLTHGERSLLEVASDPDVGLARSMASEVRRDAHKMKAFVRFRRVEDDPDGEPTYVAWHRPDHRIVPRVAPFFADRFKTMRWVILTPDASVAWDGRTLAYGAGAPRDAAPGADELEHLWKTYYRSIFNPARINLDAMRAEMPHKHWSTLPETQIITDLLREAPERVRAMVASSPGSAARFLPEARDLRSLRQAIGDCAACALCAAASGPVFGEGRSDARVMLIGEQPGDMEDRAGRPFVGPAGRVIDEALELAGIDREACYVTNAFKAFKHIATEQRRLHQRPSAREVTVCKAWLDGEIAAVEPDTIVALGGTAATALLGRRVAVSRERGVHSSPWASRLVVTWHPAAILRTPPGDARDRRFAALVDDLRLAVG